MKEKTKLKLNILKDKQVISEETYDKVIEIEKSLIQIVPNIEEIDTDFMYTHLSMAIDRVEKNKQLTEENDFIKEQLIASEFYDEARSLLASLSNEIDVMFNEPESTMILLHLSNLLSQRGE